MHSLHCFGCPMVLVDRQRPKQDFCQMCLAFPDISRCPSASGRESACQGGGVQRQDLQCTAWIKSLLHIQTDLACDQGVPPSEFLDSGCHLRVHLLPAVGEF